MMREDAPEHGVPPASRQVHVEQDDVGQTLTNELHGSGGLVGFAHQLDRVAELGPDAGPEDGVVLDQEDARPPGGFGGGHFTRSRRGMQSWTSAPSPGAERTTAEPPKRATRARMECAMPCRSSGTASGSKPRPRSRT